MGLSSSAFCTSSATCLMSAAELVSVTLMVMVVFKSKSGTPALAESVGVNPAVGVKTKVCNSALMLVTLPVNVRELVVVLHVVELVSKVPP